MIVKSRWAAQMVEEGFFAGPQPLSSFRTLLGIASGGLYMRTGLLMLVFVRWIMGNDKHELYISLDY